MREGELQLNDKTTIREMLTHRHRRRCDGGGSCFDDCVMSALANHIHEGAWCQDVADEHYIEMVWITWSTTSKLDDNEIVKLVDDNADLDWLRFKRDLAKEREKVLQYYNAVAETGARRELEVRFSNCFNAVQSMSAALLETLSAGWKPHWVVCAARP